MDVDEMLEMKKIVNKLEDEKDVKRMDELLHLALMDYEERGRKKGIQECLMKMEEFYKEKGVL